MDTSLKAIFGMDAAGFRAELKQTMAESRETVNTWANVVSGLATAAVIGLSKSAIELASHLSDTSQNLGINVVSLQALEAQHKRNGVSQEELTKALEKTRAASIAAFNGDVKHTEALAALGIKASYFIQLPLDKQYAAIGRALYAATDKTVAYNAVTQLFGEKIGPKMMESLRELGELGLPKVTSEAQKAGQVLSAETIVALDRAGDAIDDFKKKITVAVGNIIVNFRTEEGMYLLGLQFAKVVFVFGARILDAIVQGGELVEAVFKGAFIGVVKYFYNALVTSIAGVATLMNKILPDKFQINVKGIEDLKATGEGIGANITRAISQTQPTILAEKVGEVYDELIGKQQKIVDQINHVDLGKDAGKLTHAGQELQNSGVAAADALAAGGKKAADEIKTAAAVLYGIGRKGKKPEDLDEGQLEALAQNIKNNLFHQRLSDQSVAGVGFGPGGYKSPQQYLLEQEQARVQTELALRHNYSRDLGQFGQGFIDRNYSATDAERLKNLAGLTTASEQTNQKLDRLDQTLRDRIPTGAFNNREELNALSAVSAQLRDVSAKIVANS